MTPLAEVLNPFRYWRLCDSYIAITTKKTGTSHIVVYRSAIVTVPPNDSEQDTWCKNTPVDCCWIVTTPTYCVSTPKKMTCWYVCKCICVHVDTHRFLLCSLACLHIWTNACLLRYTVSLYMTICVYPSRVWEGECVYVCVYVCVCVCACLCVFLYLFCVGMCVCVHVVSSTTITPQQLQKWENAERCTQRHSVAGPYENPYKDTGM